MEFNITDDKKVDVTYDGASVTFEFRKKRAFSVFIELLRSSPDFVNVHAIGQRTGLTDPNRALADLKNANGDAFEGFLVIERRERGLTYVKLELDLLFQTVNKSTEVVRLFELTPRMSLSDDQLRRLFVHFDGVCSLTGVKLTMNLKEFRPTFLKNFQISVGDHRRPISKFGSNEISNMQLISFAANLEKNKVCVACKDPRCNQCALAFPETMAKIHPTGQDISTLRKS